MLTKHSVLFFPLQERWAEPGAELAAAPSRPAENMTDEGGAPSPEKRDADGDVVPSGRPKRFLPFSTGPRQCAQHPPTLKYWENPEYPHSLLAVQHAALPMRTCMLAARLDLKPPGTKCRCCPSPVGLQACDACAGASGSHWRASCTTQALGGCMRTSRSSSPRAWAALLAWTQRCGVSWMPAIPAAEAALECGSCGSRVHALAEQNLLLM